MSYFSDSLYDPTKYTAAGSTGSVNQSGTNRFEDLGTESFLKLIVAELQNQDPMNPTDNAQMLQQINQIREISSNDKLSSSLESVMLGQSMATASGLLGQTVTGVNSLGDKVTGKVDRVVFENGSPRLHVGSFVIDIGSVTEMNAE